MAKHCLSKGLRTLCCPSPPFWDKEDTSHAQKGSSWVKSEGMMSGHNVSCFSQKPSLQGPCWPMGTCTPRVDYVWEKTPDNWLKVNKHLEELPYLNDLITTFQCSYLRGTPTPFLSGCVDLPYFCLNNLFLCVLSHLCSVSNKLGTCI